MKQTAVKIVAANRAMTPRAPGFKCTRSVRGSGFAPGIAKCRIAAGISQLITEGTKSAKNSKKVSLPFCQTISVVMSPNGENAPPALAATTIETQPKATKRGDWEPTAMTTAPMMSAVVRLSRTAESGKAMAPVIQNNCR